MGDVSTDVKVVRAMAAAAAVTALLAAAPALAMGGGDGGGTGGSTPSTGTSTGSSQRLACPKGFVLSADEKKCLKVQSDLRQELPAVGWGDQDDDFLEAAVLAHAGLHREAITAFTALNRGGDPYVLNYLGYSHRKLGEVETALGYYAEALRIRPDYVRARQYLGEGLLSLGRLEDARDQLRQIALHCGTGCEPYVLLQGQIEAFERAT